MNFAVIKKDNVVNIIVADSLETAEEATGLTCVEYTNETIVGIGYTYDGSNFIRPVISETPVDPA
jgi:hypothetical protein